MENLIHDQFADSIKVMQKAIEACLSLADIGERVKSFRMTYGKTESTLRDFEIPPRMTNPSPKILYQREYRARKLQIQT